MTTYECVLRGDSQFSDKVDVVSDFSVFTDKFTVASASGNSVIGGTCNIVGDISSNGTSILDATTRNLSNIGTVGCGAVTSTGAVEGTSLTDGTMTITAGGFSGVDSLTTTGAITSGGNLICGNFVVTQLDGSIAAGSTGAEFVVDTSGNTTLGGTLDSGAITSTGAVAGTSISDGVASLDGSGNLTGGVTLNCSTLTCTGSVSGDANLDQLKTNNSITIAKDGTTYTSLTNAPSNGSFCACVQAHTGDDAALFIIGTKASGSAGVIHAGYKANGSTSAPFLEATWVDTEKPKVKYSASWGGGTGTTAAYATILMSAS